MNKLEDCRNKIDLIDEEIIKLFEKRMDVVKEVVQYKIENNLDVLDSSREFLMIKKNLEKVKNEEYKKYYEEILNTYLKVSKSMQKAIILNKNNKVF